MRRQLLTAALPMGRMYEFRLILMDRSWKQCGRRLDPIWKLMSCFCWEQKNLKDYVKIDASHKKTNFSRTHNKEGLLLYSIETPVPVRSIKLNNFKLGQYIDG